LKSTFCCVCALILGFKAYAQNWPKYYTNNKFTSGILAIESYDHGIIAISWADINANFHKTDINGNILCQRLLEGALIYGIHETKDRGYIVTGCVADKNNQTELFMLKLNACIELEWCKKYEFDAPSNGLDVIQMKDGGFLINLVVGQITYNCQCGVIRTDAKGNIIWKYYYAAEIPSILLDKNKHILVTSNYRYQINKSDRSDLNLTMLDSNGTVLWKTTKTGAEYYPVKTVETYENGYVTMVDWHLFFWDSVGRLLSDKIITNNIPTNVVSINSFDIIRSTDSTYLILVYGDSATSGYGGAIIIKINTKGDFIKKAGIYGRYDSTGYYNLGGRKITATSDNKYLIAGGKEHFLYSGQTNYSEMFIAKINSNLDLDSFYSKKYKYDSLCPNVIPDSGNISLDQAEIVNLDTIGVKYTGFNIYPNPTRDYFNISAIGFSNQLFDLTIYDVLGREVSKQQFMPDAAGNIARQISISHVMSGCYFISLSQ